MLAKCDSWPKVLPVDDGIRPAGSPSRCFYCNQEVGEPHGKNCVTIRSMTRYGVFMGDERVGTYRIHDPAFWDIHLREFHKNDGTWCSDNAMDEIKWESDDAKARVEQAIGEGCACWTLRFVVDEIEDAGPLIEVGRRPGVV